MHPLNDLQIAVHGLKLGAEALAAELRRAITNGEHGDLEAAREIVLGVAIQLEAVAR